MKVLVAILTIEAALCGVFGLWAHDWRLIAAGLICFVIWPMISKEIAKEDETWQR
jgi:hypothetical protein